MLPIGMKPRISTKNTMKLKHIAHLALAAIVACAIVTNAKAEDKKDEKDLKSQAKITKKEAAKTALAKVPNGKIKDAELEEEKGRLIWSFDIATPDSKNITEVVVDAKTGEVVSVDVETPEDQAKEKAADAKEEKEKKEKKEKKD
jgi:uncharacterized membrane protein YkoI